MFGVFTLNLCQSLYRSLPPAAHESVIASRDCKPTTLAYFFRNQNSKEEMAPIPDSLDLILEVLSNMPFPFVDIHSICTAFFSMI